MWNGQMGRIIWWGTFLFPYPGDDGSDQWNMSSTPWVGNASRLSPLGSSGKMSVFCIPMGDRKWNADCLIDISVCVFHGLLQLAIWGAVNGDYGNAGSNKHAINFGLSIVSCLFEEPRNWIVLSVLVKYIIICFCESNSSSCISEVPHACEGIRACQSWQASCDNGDVSIWVRATACKQAEWCYRLEAFPSKWSKFVTASNNKASYWW